MNSDDETLRYFMEEIYKSVEIINTSKLFSISELSEREIKQWQTFYFNGFNWNYTTDTELKKDKIESDGNLAGIFTLNHEKNFPNSIDTVTKDRDYSSEQEGFVFYQGLMDSLGLHLDCNHIYNQILFIDDHKAHMNRIDYNKAKIKKIPNYLSNNEDVLNKLDNDLLNISNISKETEFQFVRGNSNVIFWADNNSHFKSCKRRIEAEFRSVDITPYYPRKKLLPQYYYNSFFSNVTCFGNDNLYQVCLHDTLDLFVNSTNYKSATEGVIFNDRIF